MVRIQNKSQKSREHIKNSKMAKCQSPLAWRVGFYRSLNFWKTTKICVEDVAGGQGLPPNNISHTNPLNFPEIQTAIKTLSSMPGPSNLVILLFLIMLFWFLASVSYHNCFFYYDIWQGHETQSCKGPIELYLRKVFFC